MGEMRFTKGPWRAELHEKSGIIYVMGKLSREAAVNMLGDGVVAEVNASDCTDDGMFPPRDPEAEANAALIASAPDLYEALNEIAGNNWSIGVPVDSEAASVYAQIVNEMQRIARAALRRAEGEQNG